MEQAVIGAQDTDVMGLALHPTRFKDITVTPGKSTYNPGEDVTFRGLLEWRDAHFRWLPAKGLTVELKSNGGSVGFAVTGDDGRFAIVHRLPFAGGRYLYRMYFAGRGFPHFWRECYSDPIQIIVESSGNGNWEPPPAVPWDKVLLYGSIGLGAVTLVWLMRRAPK